MYSRFMDWFVPSVVDRIFVQATTPLWKAFAAVLVVVCGAAALSLAQKLTPKQRRKLIVTTTLAAGFFYTTEFFIPKDNFLTPAITPAGKFFLLVGVLALGLAIVNLMRIHAGNVAKRKPGYYNSIVLIGGMAVMFFFRIWEGIEGHPDFIAKGYGILFFGIFAAMKATVFSILAFYIVSAAYRAFRVRSAEATLMMSAAVLVMVGQIPLTIALTAGLPEAGALSRLRLESINTWLQIIPSAAAGRAVILGVYVGAMAISLRLWLGLEKGSYFEQDL